MKSLNVFVLDLIKISCLSFAHLVSVAAIDQISLQYMAADEIGKSQENERQKHCLCLEPLVEESKFKVFAFEPSLRREIEL